MIRVSQQQASRHGHDWFVFVSELHQAVIRVTRGSPEGPPLSGHALCALVDIARRNELFDLEPSNQPVSGAASAEQAFRLSETQSLGEPSV